MLHEMQLCLALFGAFQAAGQTRPARQLLDAYVHANSSPSIEVYSGSNAQAEEQILLAGVEKHYTCRCSTLR